MIRVTAEFVLKEGAYESALETAAELIRLTRQEAGCVAYDLARSTQDERILIILEAWESQAALDAHSASPHFTSLVPKLAGLCASAPVVKLFEQMI